MREYKDKPLLAKRFAFSTTLFRLLNSADKTIVEGYEIETFTDLGGGCIRESGAVLCM